MTVPESGATSLVDRGNAVDNEREQMPKQTHHAAEHKVNPGSPVRVSEGAREFLEALHRHNTAVVPASDGAFGRAAERRKRERH